MKMNKMFVLSLLIIALLTLCAFRFDVNNGDSVSIFNNTVIPEGDIVSGDSVTVFGNTEILGEIRGDVVAVFGNVDIYGKVGGDVVAVFGNVTIHSQATIGGDAAGVFGNVDKAEGATVRGESIDTSIDIFPRNKNIGFGTIFGMAIVYGLCCLVVLIMPDRVMLMARNSQVRIPRSAGIGFLVLLITLLVIPILIITIIGIIPALLVVLAFAATILISSTAIYIALGQRIAAAVEGKNAVYIHLLIGLVVVSAIQMVPVLGFLAGTAVFLVGLGVAFDTKLGGVFAKKTAI